MIDVLGSWWGWSPTSCGAQRCSEALTPHASEYGSNALAIARPAPRGVLIVGPGAARGARGNRLSAALRGPLG